MQEIQCGVRLKDHFMEFQEDKVDYQLLVLELLGMVVEDHRWPPRLWFSGRGVRVLGSVKPVSETADQVIIKVVNPMGMVINKETVNKVVLRAILEEELLGVRIHLGEINHLEDQDNMVQEILNKIHYHIQEDKVGMVEEADHQAIPVDLGIQDILSGAVPWFPGAMTYLRGWAC